MISAVGPHDALEVSISPGAHPVNPNAFGACTGRVGARTFDLTILRRRRYGSRVLSADARTRP